MKFIDEVKISVISGNGGPGAVSFRREKFVPRGGPDGGDGGDGGSVYLEGDSGKLTLLDLQFSPLWRAEHGRKGEGRQKTGRRGKDVVVKVPFGTVVTNRETGELVADITPKSPKFLIAAGGKGGKGNTFFKNATRQAPDFAQPGTDGESGEYILTLKLMADVGLLGLPNAGKSTFLSTVSAARPKVADYPFTTITPMPGVVSLSNERTFVIADIPGLIEGASDGKGLGTRFLKHVERTSILLHLVEPPECNETTVEQLLERFNIIRGELASHSNVLSEKKQLVVCSKADLLEEVTQHSLAEGFLKETGISLHFISSVSRYGIASLMEQLWPIVAAHRISEL